MLFSSPEFLIGFLPAAFLSYFFLLRLSNSLAILWLTICSIFFYSWWNVNSLPVLITSILFNNIVGRLLVQKKDNRKIFLWIGVSVNLIALAYYKYFFFLGTQFYSALGLGSFPIHVDLPIGISFFTFTQIAYLVDIYRDRSKKYNFLNYSLFVSYFPHLIAGPILHHKEMMPQFEAAKPFRLSSQHVAEGLGIFSIGLAKKLLVADPLGVYANFFFNGVSFGGIPGLFESLLGTLSYTFQLYFDFSGYSDMAVGISAMFGIWLPVNFNSPYKSRDISDFWRRWHMTLSRFLRDYLYISLGGNRKGKVRRYFNLMATMTLGGIWHGAGWTFLLWGFLHGSYLIVHQAWKTMADSSPLFERLARPVRWAGMPLTFAAVALAWIPFRASSLRDSLTVFKGLTGQQGIALPSQIVGMIPGLSRWVDAPGSVALLADGTIMGFVELCVLLMMGFVLAFFFKNTMELPHRRRLVIAACLLPLLFQKVFFGSEVAFLYFQF